MRVTETHAHRRPIRRTPSSPRRPTQATTYTKTPSKTGRRSGRHQANRLSWETPFSQVLDWSDAPFAKWFTGGKLNVTYNCVDRHVEAGNGDRVAIHWEGERVGDERTLSYSDLQAEVSKAANALDRSGPGRR